MDIELIRRIHFQYRELLVDSLSKIDNKQCYLVLFKYLHSNGIPCNVKKKSGVFFTLNLLEQSVVYKLDEVITKYE